MTTSGVDVTFPVDNVKVSKTAWRAQQVIIKDELNDLFSRIGDAGRIAYSNLVDSDEINRRIRTEFSKTNYARDNLAFNWRTL